MDNVFYPIRLFTDWLTYSVFLIERDTLLAEAVNFFVFDVLKIFILLFVIVFIVSFVRTFLPQKRIKNILSHKNRFVGNILAAVFGIFTPFCTCSAIPLFIGFIEAGVPLGVTFPFLVASPMINEITIGLLFGLFGWKVTLLYITSGLLIAIFSGIIIGKLKLEKEVAEFVFKNKIEANSNLKEHSLQKRAQYGAKYAAGIIKKVWPFVLIGIGVGAWIHGYVPTDFLARFAGSDKWYAVPLATLLGIPLYSNAAGILPLISVLTEKGVAVGTTLAFMMAVTGLSLPEFMILKKIMSTKLILIFAAIVGVGILFTGYLFNLILR